MISVFPPFGCLAVFLLITKTRLHKRRGAIVGFLLLATLTALLFSFLLAGALGLVFVWFATKANRLMPAFSLGEALTYSMTLVYALTVAFTFGWTLHHHIEWKNQSAELASGVLWTEPQEMFLQIVAEDQGAILLGGNAEATFSEEKRPSLGCDF